MDGFVRDEIERLGREGLRRRLPEVSGPQGPRAIVDGRDALVFCSNDYLGLASNTEMKRAAVEATEKYGTGAGASRLVSGSMEAHRSLEERLRLFKGTEAALLFNSGYNANLGVITALSDRSTEIFSDRLNHASIVDACLLSRAKVTRFQNRDIGALEALLKKSTARRKLIVTDGVFSMDGAIAPINDIAFLLDRHCALLVLDDAHGTGVLGEGGRGTLEHMGVAHPSIVQMGTLGKALGSFGAFVAADKDVIELLVSRARPFIYTTALPPAVCAASEKAVEIVAREPGLRARLSENARLVREGLKAVGLEVTEGITPIIPVLAGDARRAVEISRRLLEKGVFVQAIRPPTVPEGTARLRVTVSAAHTAGDVRTAVRAIKEAFDETP